MRGRFLTFEGFDGCGKTTQLKLLAAYLRRRGVGVVVTREPGGTPLGERIRALLLSSASRGMDVRTELLLMFASRAEHVARVIQPALAAGKVVLCDRFTDASLAYQGYGRGLERSFIRELDRVACRGLKPHLTFVVDINPRTSLRRAKRRNRRARADEERFERETRAFYERVRRGYRAIARAEPQRVQWVNGEDTIENIHRKIVTRAARRLGLTRMIGSSRC
ncbi:MAG: dTMP kinase [Terriglobia bacterium]